MRLIKKCLIIVISLALLLSSIAFAEEKDMDSLLDSQSLKISEDYDDLQSISSSSLEKIKNILRYDNSKVRHASLNINKNKYFKMYFLDNPNFASWIKGGKNLDKIISSKYNWIAPIYEGRKAKYLATFIKNTSNRWVLAGFSENVNKAALELLTDKGKLKKLLNRNNIINPSTIKFIKADQYHMDFIYVKEAGNEYAIVLNNNPKGLGLQNGKIYKMSVLAEKLHKKNSITSKKRMGGGFLADTNSIMSVRSASAFLTILSLILLFLLNFKKTSKGSN